MMATRSLSTRLYKCRDWANSDGIIGLHTTPSSFVDAAGEREKLASLPELPRLDDKAVVLGCKTESVI
jgi:hypothetical protein